MTMLNDHVTTFEVSKILHDLGVDQRSLFYWVKIPKNNQDIWFLLYADDVMPDNPECYSAFTAGELGDLLPHSLSPKSGASSDNCLQYFKDSDDIHYIGYKNANGGHGPLALGENEANVRGRLLIRLIEDELIKLEY